MKRIVLASTLTALALCAAPAHASDVGVSFGVNVGVPVVPGPPVAAVPVYPPPPVAIEGPPDFIEPPGLGFYVAAGVPYDLFFIDNIYYLCSGNVWYESPYYNGPWTAVYYDDLPFYLRRYPLERIHYFRDDFYRHHRHDAYWRGHRYFNPGWHGRDWDRRDWHGRDWNGARSWNGQNWNGARSWNGQNWNGARSWNGQNWNGARSWNGRDWNTRDWSNRYGDRHGDRRNYSGPKSYTAPTVDPRPVRVDPRPSRMDPRPGPAFRQPVRTHENWGRPMNFAPRTPNNYRPVGDNGRRDHGNRWEGRGR